MMLCCLKLFRCQIKRKPTSILVQQLHIKNNFKSLTSHSLLKPPDSFYWRVNRRNFISEIWRIINFRDKNAAFYFKKDKIDRSTYSLIYKSNHMTVYTRNAALFLVSIFIFIWSYSIYNRFFRTEIRKIQNDPFDSSGLLGAKYGPVLGLLFGAVIYLICIRTVHRIYYSETHQKFKLATLNWWFPLNSRIETVSAGQAKEYMPRIKGLEKFCRTFENLFGNTIINGKKFLVIPEDFRLPGFYNLLYGHGRKRDIRKYLIELEERKNKFFDE